MSDWLVGVDLGGTRIRAVLCGPDGRVIGRASALTQADGGPDAVIARIYETIRSAVGDRSWERVRAIGIGAPGPLDPHAGVVVRAPNLPGWVDVPLRAMIAREFGIPASLGNDANLAALGEHAFGAGRGVEEMVYMTISTGIGGGIISRGELLLGRHGFAGEIGHQTIVVDGPVCGCGNRGCLEAMAAGPAIARMGREAAESGRGAAILEAAGGDLQAISSRTVAAVAHRGDETARAIILRAARYIGIGLANLANILDPELFVLGGGVTRIGDLLFDAIRETIRKVAMPPVRGVRVEEAALGDDVVLMGAVELARRALDGHT